MLWLKRSRVVGHTNNVRSVFDYVDKGRAKAGPHHETMGHYSDGPEVFSNTR